MMGNTRSGGQWKAEKNVSGKLKQFGNKYKYKQQHRH